MTLNAAWPMIDEIPLSESEEEASRRGGHSDSPLTTYIEAYFRGHAEAGDPTVLVLSVGDEASGSRSEWKRLPDIPHSLQECN